MRSIRDTLRQFLKETGPGNPGSKVSASVVIRVFESYLNGWAHEDLNPFERQRFEEEWADNRRFCDIFDGGHIKPHHLSVMLGHYAIRHGPGTKGFLKAVGPVMQKLASWLSEQGFWTAEDRRLYGELVGEEPGGDLSACERFAELLHDYVERHPVDAPEDLPDEDYHDDQVTIAKVEPGKLHLDVFVDVEAPVVIALPRSVTAKAKVGWSVALELARIRDRWRILGVGAVRPAQRSLTCRLRLVAFPLHDSRETARIEYIPPERRCDDSGKASCTA